MWLLDVATLPETGTKDGMPVFCNTWKCGHELMGVELLRKREKGRDYHVTSAEAPETARSQAVAQEISSLRETSQCVTGPQN